MDLCDYLNETFCPFLQSSMFPIITKGIAHLNTNSKMLLGNKKGSSQTKVQGRLTQDNILSLEARRRNLEILKYFSPFLFTF